MSATAQAVYDQDHEPETIHTVEELDSLLDRIAVGATPEAPPLVALDMPGRQRSLMVGLRGTFGTLNFIDFTSGGASSSRADTAGR